MQGVKACGYSLYYWLAGTLKKILGSFMCY